MHTKMFLGGAIALSLTFAVGFGEGPIAEESIGFGTGDPRFHIAPTTDLVTQTITATFSVNAVAETFFKAAIEPIKSYEHEEPVE